MLNLLELTGRADTHIRESEAPRLKVHWAVAGPLQALKEGASAQGIELEIVSSFRGFDRQVAIWNAKFSGERRLLDRQGRPIDAAQLDESALIDAILIWSALPGASRHHWGSDVDVIDRATIPTGYVPQLVQHEFGAQGVFARLNDWLTRNMARFGFFRPYTLDRGGVMPEPWHLSYAPVAAPALELLTIDVLQDAIENSEMRGRELVLARLPELYERFVRNVDAPAR